jgi:hypothetical protein
MNKISHLIGGDNMFDPNEYDEDLNEEEYYDDLNERISFDPNWD